MIQKMFDFLGIGEKGGSGADVIIKGWTDNHWDIPTIAEKNSPDRIETCLRFGNSDRHTTKTTTETNKKSVKTTETTTETNKKSVKTTETILKIISTNPKIKSKELAAVCGITEDGVAYHIKKLKLAGKIVRIGGSRNGGEWKIVQD